MSPPNHLHWSDAREGEEVSDRIHRQLGIYKHIELLLDEKRASLLEVRGKFH
jgi:hypothetical protein